MPAYGECSIYDKSCRSKTCGHGKPRVSEYTIDIISTTGVPFRVVLGKRLKDGGVVVSFYDRRYDHTEYGQFVSDYRPDDLYNFCQNKFNLNLYSGVDSWQVDRDNLMIIGLWLGMLINHWGE